VKLGKPFRVRRVRPEKPRRVNARIAPERVDGQAGVFRNRVYDRPALDRRGRLRDRAIVVQGLETCVVLKRGAGLLRLGDGLKVAKREELDGKMAEQAPDLSQLVGIAGRNQ